MFSEIISQKQRIQKSKTLRVVKNKNNNNFSKTSRPPRKEWETNEQLDSFSSPFDVSGGGGFGSFDDEVGRKEFWETATSWTLDLGGTAPTSLKGYNVSFLLFSAL